MAWWRNISFIVYGLSNFTKNGYEKSQKFYNEKIEAFDLKGKKYMVTGANSGLGFCNSKFLAGRGATVYMICRNMERGEKAKEEIINETKNENVFMIVCDVSNQNDVRNMVDNFIKSGNELDVVVHNAGVMLEKKNETSEGLETTLATNTISGFLLTNLLMPVLEKSEDPRVIFVSSGGGLTEKLFVGEDYDKDLKGDKYNGMTLYARTKRQQIVLNELYSKKYKDSKIKFYCCHPGWSDTAGVRESMPNFYEKLKDKLRTPEQGADCINWLCCSKELKNEQSGEFFRDRQIEKKHFFLGYTEPSLNETEKFWDWLNQIKLNTIKRVPVTISLLDETGKPTMVWTLTNAWPTKISSTDLKSEGNEVAIESIEIVHEGLTIANK